MDAVRECPSATLFLVARKMLFRLNIETETVTIVGKNKSDIMLKRAYESAIFSWK